LTSLGSEAQAQGMEEACKNEGHCFCLKRSDEQSHASPSLVLQGTHQTVLMARLGEQA